jgi:opacity protein-like surface antigen
MSRFYFLIFFLACFSSCSFAQEKDSLPYEKYHKRLVLYADFGWSTAPMSISYPFINGIKNVKYRNNFNPVLGFGFSYKWMSLRFGVTLPNSIRSKNKFGKTKYYDLGFDFSFRNMFFDVDFHQYIGYSMKDAHRWNDTISPSEPNLIREDINAASFSINAWQFWNNHFKMAAFRGKTASYQRDVKTFYLKYTVNYHGISSNQALLPIELHDTTESKTSSNAIAAFDIGVVPGYAYVRRWRMFQFGIMGGVGLVLQSKLYTFDATTRSFLGLAPRVDLRVIGGINKPKYFIMFVSDFDNKSIAFNDFTYKQTFYNLKLVGGIRLNVSKKKESQEAAEKKAKENDEKSKKER